MRLIKGEKAYDCVAASVAMVLNVSLEYVHERLFNALPTPFPAPWSDLPKVPDMNIICDWFYDVHSKALIPFEYHPTCTPHKDCPPVSVYPRNTNVGGSDAEFNWNRQLSYGSGLIEGVRIGREISHMVAWSGDAIYDPRGMIYSRNVAVQKFQFQVRRFWLAREVK